MQAGFTLVEVMAASALLSILAICVVRAWSVFDQMSFDNMLRQKAVFVLNGEMERLARMWNTSTFATSAKNAGGYPAIPGITGSTIRYTYGTAMEAASFVTASSSISRARIPPSGCQAQRRQRIMFGLTEVATLWRASVGLPVQ